MKARLGRLLEGPVGSAREVHVEWEEGDPPDRHATLGSWFLTCPGQSPAWDHYSLGLIHLRPIPGARPPVVRVPGATHELILLALNPERQPREDDPETWHFLTPVNVMEQFTVPSDDAARELLGLAALSVVEGVLWAEAPLSGQVEPWRSAVVKTSAHLRGEEHAP